MHCRLCPLKARETRDHLFFNCNFSVRVWSYLQIDWSSGDSMSDLVIQARNSFDKHVSLKWCSLHVGIYGSLGMPKSSEMRGPALISGEVPLGMISLRCKTGSNLLTRMTFSSGYLSFPLKA